jgi:ubiquinol-cytochrome c reductase iron-sulfur subunit
MAEAVDGSSHGEHDGTRRDFLMMAAGGMAAVGVGAAIWPLVDSLNPAADALAVAELEVDIGPIAEGQAVTVLWRGTPVFIRHRTAAEIAEAEGVSQDDLPDPEVDGDRVQKPEWLVLVGVCTHLGCIPLGQKPTDKKGDFDGWFCPCHGSHYDSSGRIRKGPAPANLPVPPYEFVSDTLVKIG